MPRLKGQLVRAAAVGAGEVDREFVCKKASVFGNLFVLTAFLLQQLPGCASPKDFVASFSDAETILIG